MIENASPKWHLGLIFGFGDCAFVLGDPDGDIQKIERVVRITPDGGVLFLEDVKLNSSAILLRIEQGGKMANHLESLWQARHQKRIVRANGNEIVPPRA